MGNSMEKLGLYKEKGIELLYLSNLQHLNADCFAGLRNRTIDQGNIDQRKYVTTGGTSSSKMNLNLI